MENVMTNGFCELNENEMMETEGGLVTIIYGLINAYVEGATGKTIEGHVSSAASSVTNSLYDFGWDLYDKWN